MPTTSPLRSTRAPPLLPGLIAALVWITSGRALPLGSLTWRPRALTMPSVTLDWRPSGLPIGQDEVADREGGRIAEGGRGQAGGVDLDDRDVVGDIAADERSRIRVPVGERHGERGRAAHDMGVRDDVALRVVDDARAEALVGLDLDDCRLDLLDDATIWSWSAPAAPLTVVTAVGAGVAWTWPAEDRRGVASSGRARIRNKGRDG